MFRPKNILVATDFSKDSAAALEDGAQLAARFHARLHLLHVADEVRQCAADYCLTNEEMAAARGRIEKEARSRLAAEANRLKKRLRVPVRTEVRFGDACAEILNEEREKNIDLLVAARHARHGWGSRLFGHLSEKLARDSVCDTLLVRAAS